MAEGKHHEIELKYLIRCPDRTLLEAQPECEVWEITQTYLWDGENGLTRRVRKVLVNGELRYYRTFKSRVSALTAEEDENVISEEDYSAYLLERDTGRQPVLKTRYRIPYRGHTLEFDLYPFWQDRAILEIELESEDDLPDIPDYVEIVRDVTGEKAYKNRQLAKRVPMEAI